MRLLRLLALALLVGAPAGALAQEPGSYARFTNNNRGLIFVDLSYVAADNCQAILDIRRSAPGGRPVDFRAVPLTVTIGPDPAGCSDSRVVRTTTHVNGGMEPNLVDIYFVRPDGRILKHEKVSVGI